jgi:hypothetical protein
VGKFLPNAYLPSLPELPLAELCARLRGQYGPTSYGKAPLQGEAARRLEALSAEIERLRARLVDFEDDNMYLDEHDNIVCDPDKRAVMRAALDAEEGISRKVLPDGTVEVEDAASSD